MDDNKVAEQGEKKGYDPLETDVLAVQRASGHTKRDAQMIIKNLADQGWILIKPLQVQKK